MYDELRKDSILHFSGILSVYNVHHKTKKETNVVNVRQFY